MEITLGELLNGKEPLEKLVNLEINIRTAFRLSKVITKVNTELQLFEEKRMELVNKYGTADDDGNVTVSQENIAAFQNELGELISLEVALDFEPVDIDEIGDVKMTAAEMMFIQKFVKE
jgi:hypothetical protein